jgi:hypothetical protein
MFNCNLDNIEEEFDKEKMYKLLQGVSNALKLKSSAINACDAL